MKVLSITSRKGGTGKTSTTFNLAHEIARKGRLCVVIDLDDQCDATNLFDLRKHNRGIKDFFEGRITIDQIAEMKKNNLYYIRGSQELNNLERGSYSQVLERGLNSEYFGQVDLVIIDHAPSLTHAGLAGLLCSTDIMIVLDTEPLSIRNLDNLTADIISAGIPDSAIMGILANKVNGRRGLAEKNLQYIKNRWGAKVFDTHIKSSYLIPLSNEHRSSVRKLGKGGVVTAYSDLADEVLERLGI